MRYPRSVHSTFRYLVAIVIFMAALLPFFDGMVSAQDEKPSNVRAFPNSPGMITITWDHSGTDVYWFVLEQESPAAVNQMDRDKRAWSVLGLQPSRTYRYQICAVYLYHRKCSSEDGGGYASVTTMPPERAQSGGGQAPGGNPSAPYVPKPKPLYSPKIAAMPMRPASGHPQSFIYLRWLNPVDVKEYSLERMQWHREDKFFSESSVPGHGDYEMKQNTTYRYKLCVSNPVNRICSGEIFASSTGVAASFESVNYPKRYIRHRNSLGELTPVNNDSDSRDIAFFLRPGLNGSASSVSFESVNYPGHFLRHQGYRIKLQPNDRSELFAKDATFVVRPGLRNIPDLVSFEAVNFPGHFIRHQNYQLWIAKIDGSQLFQYDASFRQTDHYVGHLRPPAQLQPREYLPVPSGASRQDPSAAVKSLQQKPSPGAAVVSNQCRQGFVWRAANANDLVCVPPEARTRVAQENAAAASRINPQGAYGPNTCVTGYVWREAFAGDLVCVTAEARLVARQENDLAASRRQ